jgi:hypothetical protein
MVMVVMTALVMMMAHCVPRGVPKQPMQAQEKG